MILLGWALACGGWEVVPTGGQVCVGFADGDTAAPTAVTLDEGSPLEVWYAYRGADGHAHDVGCEVVVDGTALRVETWHRQKRTGPSGKALLFGQVSCSTPPLAAGAYTLVYGANTTPIDVPGEVAPVCLTH